MAMSRKGPGNLLEVFCYDYGPGQGGEMDVGWRALTGCCWAFLPRTTVVAQPALSKRHNTTTEIAICRWVYSRLGQGMDGGDPAVEEQQMEQSLDAFFREPVDDVKPGNVRWISITGLEPAVVVRLANRYKLHPLQVRPVGRLLYGYR